MNKTKIRVGLIGIGGRLRGVVRDVLKHDVDGGIQITTVYDPDTLSHDSFRKILNYDYKVAADEKEVCQDPDVDWVFIGSWNCVHARQAIAALEAGKHVFCEKPLATSLEDCLAIREAAQRSGRTFFFGLVLRYSPHYRKVAEIVRSGKLGRIVSFEFNETLGFNHGGYIFGNWRREPKYSGTHMLEKCCHDLDLANWITDSLPVKAASFGGLDIYTQENAAQVQRIGLSEDGVAPFQAWADPHRVDAFDGEAGIFDNQVTILEYANGVRATFHTNCCTSIAERRFYICGTEGSLRADLITHSVEWRPLNWDDRKELFDTEVDDNHGGGDLVMAEALYRTMFFGDVPLASVEEGIRSALAAFGIDRAVENGGLADLRPYWELAGIDPSSRSTI